MKYPVPQFPLKFFRWFCRPSLVDALEGDLIELYHERLRIHGKFKADIKFYRDVLLLFRPGIVRAFQFQQRTNPIDMYKNYFKISLRQLIKNKTFTAINLFGLTLGFLSFLFIGMYIQDELSFDRFHRDSDRMYRVQQHETKEDGSVRNVVSVARLVGEEVANQNQEVESYCRLAIYGRITVGNDPLNRSYEPVMSGDPNFFTFFDFPLIEGDPATVLSSPNTIVLSEKMAKKYFGNEPAVGKHLWTSFDLGDRPASFTVSGIMKDLPKNSHLQIDILFSESSWPSIFPSFTNFVSADWTSNEFVTYFKLKDGATPKVLEDKITSLVRSNYPSDRKFQSTFSLQPLKDIHLYSENIEGNEFSNNAGGLKPFHLYMFGAVAFLLLFIACLNYTNMTTAASLKRTREIGVRKTLGAQRGNMIGQFIADSLLLSVIAFGLAFIILQLILPSVRDFVQKDFQLLSLPLSWYGLIVVCIIVTSLLSALYPALISLKVSTVRALKGEIKISSGGVSVRKILLGAQFAVSIAMIASTMIIHRQLNYMRSKDIGVNVENLLVIDINSGNLRRNFENVKAEFSKPSEVVSITTSTRVPGEWKPFPVATVNAEGQSEKTDMIFVGIDQDFLKTYDIELKAGRNFTAGPSDSTKVILTETGVKSLGLQNPIGSMIEIPTVRFGAGIETLDHVFRAEVVGVVADFHFESLKKEQMPVIFGAPNTEIQRIDYYTLRVNTTRWSETLEKMKEINQKIDPNNPMEYTFLDSRFEEFYQADAKRGQIFLTFSVIIVLITVLGLFAVVSYTLESRIKEIGVRKVLGASVGGIVALISKEFLLVVIVGALIGLPASAYFMNNWLEEFAFRIPMGIGVFVLAVFLSLLIAFLTIGIRTIRAARENPVKSLRSE